MRQNYSQNFDDDHLVGFLFIRLIFSIFHLLLLFKFIPLGRSQTQRDTNRAIKIFARHHHRQLNEKKNNNRE